MSFPLQASYACPNSLQMNLSWGVRAQQQASSPGDAGETGQGAQAASAHRGKLVG